MAAKRKSLEAWPTEAEVAHHEAGHHVAFRHLRPESAEIDFGEISIVRNEAAGSLGHHAPDEGFGPSGYRPATKKDKAAAKKKGKRLPEFVAVYNKSKIRNYIVELYAGAAAELRYAPKSKYAQRTLSDPTPEEEAVAEETGPLKGEASDRQKAEQWLVEVAPERTARKSLRARLRRRAGNLVKEHWDEISVVAAELLKRKTIDGVEADLAIRIAAGDSDAAGQLQRYRANRAAAERSAD